MFGVKAPVFLLDALWRKIGNRATQTIHADVMGMGQAIALCKPKVRNLKKKKKKEKEEGKKSARYHQTKIFSAKNTGSPNKYGEELFRNIKPIKHLWKHNAMVGFSLWLS